MLDKVKGLELLSKVTTLASKRNSRYRAKVLFLKERYSYQMKDWLCDLTSPIYSFSTRTDSETLVQCFVVLLLGRYWLCVMGLSLKSILFEGRRVFLP